MKELKDHDGLSWNAWFWVDKEEFEGEWKPGQLRYRVEKAVGRDNSGVLCVMVWTNLDKHESSKFEQRFYEIDLGEYAAFLDRAIAQGEVKPTQREHLIDRANKPFIPPWDISRAVVVYEDGRFTLGQEYETPYLIAGGAKYRLSCHGYEPCLYITDENGGMTVVHNAFEPFDALDCFSRGETITSITGREYDARDFCEMIEYAAGMGEINVSDAESIFGARPKEKPRAKTAEASRAKTPGTTPVKNAYAASEKKIDPESEMIIRDDPFFRVIAEYPDLAVEYCLVKNEHADSGLNAHWAALVWACRELLDDDGEDDGWTWDVGRAEASRIEADTLFSSAYRDGELNYRRAFLYPPYENGYTGVDFVRVNEALFPNGTDGLEVYEWTTDWSDYFDDGHEWWGALCLTVYDSSLDRFAVILASATD